MSCKQQVSGLLDAEPIVFEHLAREDDMLCKQVKRFSVRANINFMVEGVIKLLGQA